MHEHSMCFSTFKRAPCKYFILLLPSVADDEWFLSWRKTFALDGTRECRTTAHEWVTQNDKMNDTNLSIAINRKINRWNITENYAKVSIEKANCKSVHSLNTSIMQRMEIKWSKQKMNWEENKVIKFKHLGKS